MTLRKITRISPLAPAGRLCYKCAVRERAFTLVELLVVIGIIAILIGLTAPILARARAEGKIAACKGQLHSIGQAFVMYCNESRGRYPPAPVLPSVNPNGMPPLTDYLAPHVGRQQKVFYCPGDEEFYKTENTSYMYNAEVGLFPIEDTIFYKVFGTHSRVPLLWDAANFHGGSVPYNWLFADGHVEQFLKQAQ